MTHLELTTPVYPLCNHTLLWLKRWLALLLSFIATSTTAHSTDLAQFFIGEGAGPWAGRVYYGAELANTPDAPCQTAKLQPQQWQAVDQEGGVVRRLKAPQYAPPDPSTAAALPLKQFAAQAFAAAQALRQACITVNLAPVADTQPSAQAAAPADIYIHRGYASSPTLAGRYASAFANAMRMGSVVPTWKHFPGHSASTRIMQQADLAGQRWFPPGHKEAAIDSASPQQVAATAQAFVSDTPAFLMVSVAIFEAYGNQPAVLSPALVAMARIAQPNALLVADDLATLVLSDDDLLQIFNNVDLLISSRQAITLNLLQRLQHLLAQGRITELQVKEKAAMQKQWRAKFQ